ncbi:diguanylate cyclase [Roseateles sp.]|uniref:GGDEF domain-containing protein n=1 Tax=Roseateles sp. TaxID=1971397 RepID=UPI003BA5E8E7
MKLIARVSAITDDGRKFGLYGVLPALQSSWWRLGSRRFFALMVLTGALGACDSGTPAQIAGAKLAVQASPSQGAAAVAAAQTGFAAGQLDGQIWQRFAAIERSGYSRPQESDAALLALSASIKPGSAEWVEWLSLRGHVNAELRARSVTDALLADLEAYGRGPQAEAARLAAALLRAQVLQREGQNDMAVKSLDLVWQLSEAQASLPLRQRCYALIAAALADSGNVEMAIKAGLENLRLAQQSQSSWRRANSLAVLAYVYLRAQQGDRALQAGQEALTQALLDPDPFTLYRVHNVRAVVFSELGENQKAEASGRLTLDFARQTGSDAILALALGNSADYLLSQGKYQAALFRAEESLVLALRSGDLLSQALAHLSIGLAKIGLKQVEAGRKEVMKAIAMDEAQGQRAAVAEDWLELGVYLERAGEWAGAVDAYHRHRALFDEQMRDDSRKKVLELQAVFDDERQAKEITLLDRSNKLKAEQLRARDLQLRLWMVLGACVLQLSVLMALAYQRIRASNQALASSNADLRRQGERDPLTGLSNRRHFQTAIKRLADQGRLSGTFFLVDIDHFKRINDVWGHAAGDAVLVEVARRLSAVVREQDLVVRWGGEEFLIVVDGRQVATAEVLAQRLLDQIGQVPVAAAQGQIEVTASIGFASFPIAPNGLSVSWERAIDLVDIVMYLAKAHGRNRAYGVEAIVAEDEVALSQVACRIEAAWHEGMVKLAVLQGPVRSGGTPA